jgi:hypothetical protein
VSAGPFTVSGIDGDGTFTLIFGAIAGGIVLLRDWEKADIVGVGLLGVLSVLVAGNVYSNLGGMGGSSDIISVSAGFGLHLTMLAALLLIGAAAQGYLNSESTANQQFAGSS